MHRFSHLLYVVEGRPDSKLGLTQALSLARNFNARVSVQVLSPEFPEAYAAYKQVYQQALRTHVVSVVDAILAELKIPSDLLDIDVELMTHKVPSIGIIQTALRRQCDLVIKETSPEHPDKSGFGSIDMQLLRDCPCPLWLCRPIVNHRQQIKVAVAVDPKPEEDVAHSLCISLLGAARDPADTCSGKLQIISCRDNSIERELKNNVFLQISDSEIAQQANLETQALSDNLQNIIAESNIDGCQRVSLTDGKPSKAIPEFITQHSIDILVMGTLYQVH